MTAKLRVLAVAGGPSLALIGAEPSLAQKQGGILKT